VEEIADFFLQLAHLFRVAKIQLFFELFDSFVKVENLIIEVVDNLVRVFFEFIIKEFALKLQFLIFFVQRMIFNFFMFESLLDRKILLIVDIDKGFLLTFCNLDPLAFIHWEFLDTVKLCDENDKENLVFLQLERNYEICELKGLL
jgi:hypothetical protein